ncbi:hypothetical protein [Campylobacter gastrosuis]|uniref:Lipoprotein n=1 Tax=Campylobacter gastrosuis TaxID=2974576 RepID=A0ABT7HUF9_9BACT|nr:hypothetical protein [Campylobacter gastrosuis]MDL0090019.1 hypothetical protein [Campylobacter gastrosuis]
MLLKKIIFSVVFLMFGGCFSEKIENLNQSYDENCYYLNGIKNIFYGYQFLYSKPFYGASEYDETLSDMYEIRADVIRHGVVTKDWHKRFWEASDVLKRTSDLTDCIIERTSGIIEFLAEFYESAIKTQENRAVTMTDDFKKIVKNPIKIVAKKCYYVIGNKYDPLLDASRKNSHNRFFNDELRKIKKCLKPYVAMLETLANDDISDEFITGKKQTLKAKEALNNLFNKNYVPTIEKISDANPEQFIKSRKQIEKENLQKQLKEREAKLIKNELKKDDNLTQKLIEAGFIKIK